MFLNYEDLSVNIWIPDDHFLKLLAEKSINLKEKFPDENFTEMVKWLKDKSYIPNDAKGVINQLNMLNLLAYNRSIFDLLKKQNGHEFSGVIGMEMIRYYGTRRFLKYLFKRRIIVNINNLNF